MWLRVRESAPRTMMPLCSGERGREALRVHSETVINGLFSAPKSKTLTHTHTHTHTHTVMHNHTHLKCWTASDSDNYHPFLGTHECFFFFI